MRFSRGTRLAACLLALSISLPGGLARAAESAESPLTLTEGQSVTLTLEAPQTGEYRLELEFMALTGKTVNPQATLSLGEAYRTSVTLPRLWKDLRQGDRFAVDEKGNELVPRQEELFERQTVVLSLVGGGQPVKLEAGRYTLTLTMTAKSIELYGARLVSAVGRSYAAYTEEQADKPAGETVPIYLEAELPSRKSSAGLTATFDNSSPDISPSAADRTLLGLISAGSREGQWLEWEFEAAQPGFYKLTIGYRQNSMRGLGVRRGVTLDGKPLFDELDELVFPYTESFAALTPGGESPYQIYLDKGKHTLRLTATRGQLVEPLAALDQAIDRMNKAYRDILVITGTTPDPYRDYYLEKEIPTLLDDLAWCRDTLRAGARCIEALTGGRRGSETSPIDEAVRTLDGLLEKPYLIAQRLSLYKAQIDAVANQSAYLSSQPLELDTLELLPVEEASHRRTHSLLERIGYRAAVFFQSFLKDYSSSTAVQASGPPLKVWISVSELLTTGSAAGREQMQVLQRLCAEEFPYPVELALVNTNDVITQAIVSGKGPDVALFVPEQTVINLAVRGALADFQTMDGIETVKERFHPSALVAAGWNGGLYALPETQTWFMLFCRTDILSGLGLDIPDTWDELYHVLQVLRQRNMLVGVPEDQRVYEMLLLQRGGRVFNTDLTATDMESDVSVGAFAAWTDFFVKHSTLVAYDFYNRFRTGEMPIGIVNYTLYNQLQVAAPEIRGLWEMAPVPGVEVNGELNRAQSCVVNGCVVVQSSALRDKAFAFADWWTSDETQGRFGLDSEILLGASARYNTANVAAAAELGWTDREQATLSAARQALWDIEQTPASYYYNRNILNAFRRVVYNYETPRDVIGRYAREIDRELVRKRKQLG